MKWHRETTRRGGKNNINHYERPLSMKESIIKQLKDEIEYYKDRIETRR